MVAIPHTHQVLGPPIRLRGVIGLLAKRMGKKRLAEVCTAGDRTVEYWGTNRRTPQGPVTPNLELLCRLYGVDHQVYARMRPGCPALPLDHVVVSSPDGWWLLPRGGKWAESRQPYAGEVGGLMPARGEDLEGYDVPRLEDGLPDLLQVVMAEATAGRLKEAGAMLRGMALGLRPIAHLLPSAVWKCLNMGLDGDGRIQDRIREGIEILSQR